ncbi:hypothetical protein WA1_32640 [Scytonema hofmannii PCC 7110]|uniref:Uncharacterized protein n=1 Tax=Scytonema hofmannii PCC 7110 TaxID=128403 RepID=A0A139X436_9CYAN|nr:hypothetical protein [Scytonema hofmannii]KYC39469.1 hypothetical protein WA1_32640 [Scytonema hofmannii PCC 7110]
MSRTFIKLTGLILLLVCIYYLGQNIIFASSYYGYFFNSIPASGSMLAVISGIFTLIFFPKHTDNLGWILLGIGIVLAFLSGGVIFKTTSLWNFFVAFSALSVGYKLLDEGRFL